jgi:hypothetical protein
MAGAFGLINLLNAQTITLADQATLRPIEGAALSCDTSSNKLLTNAAGQVDIAALKACRLRASGWRERPIAARCGR